MTIDMNQFFQVFFDEAEELLAEMEKLLLAVDVARPDGDQLHAIFRTAHSIKGGASTFGLTDISEVTHVLESLLDRIRNGSMALTRGHVDAFLATKDVLKMQVEGHRDGSDVDRNAVADIRTRLTSLLPDSSGPLPPPVVLAPVVPRKDSAQSIYRIGFPDMPESDRAALVAELGMLGKVEESVAEAGQHFAHLSTVEGRDDIVSICSFLLDPATIDITVEQGPASTPGKTPDEIRAEEDAQGFGFFEPLPEPTPAAPLQEKSLPPKRETDKPHAGHESSSIRVGIEKVDQLINLVGELVITQAMIEQRTSSLDPILHEKLMSSVSQLTRNTHDLQESVMSIRMMPMDYAFSRFPRMVRDLATKLGKEVELVTQGAATELDKGLIERIIDPLTHLVRNSVDHGIEMPAVREASGKTRVGRLILSAAHQGGNIVIEVADDGAGLNRERILAKAREKGLAANDSMADSEVWLLILAPGFSTAEQVTDVSGRGVGMDVVLRNVEAMNGSITIRSVKGQGTTMSISLPLTLAILDGMSVRVGKEIYILPLGYVVESLQPAASAIREISGQTSVLKVRGDFLPLLRLHQIFNIAPMYTNPTEGVVVILESDGRRAALFVDELVGQQHVVVKNLETNYRKVPCVSGATILGDGSVSLIMDVAALVRLSSHAAAESSVS